MYVKFLQSTNCIKKTLTVSCTLLCESGDRVKFDQSSFSAYLHAVMLRHHCSEYGDKGQMFVLTTLDFQQSIDPELGSEAGQLNIKLLVASVHNLRVLLIFLDFILFVS